MIVSQGHGHFKDVDANIAVGVVNVSGCSPLVSTVLLHKLVPQAVAEITADGTSAGSRV